jgi:hypothetical protein
MAGNVFQLTILVQYAFKVLQFYVSLVEEYIRSIVPVVCVEYASK